jgi:predicted O-methyltransferase YrrM
MTHAVEQTERGRAIVGALRAITHTRQLDPEFFERCVEAARDAVGPGFGALLEQDAREFEQMLEHAKGAHSALEIGSRYGESIKLIASVMAPGGRVVAVDLPYSDCVDQPDPAPFLQKNMQMIANSGFDAKLFIGNSRHPDVVQGVKSLAPFDFVFIDGDHSEEGVKADWENYGPLGKIVAFHDIVNNAGCFKLWNEIKKTHRTVEYTSSVWLGIGVVFMDQGA